MADSRGKLLTLNEAVLKRTVSEYKVTPRAECSPPPLASKQRDSHILVGIRARTGPY